MMPQPNSSVNPLKQVPAVPYPQPMAGESSGGAGNNALAAAAGASALKAAPAAAGNALAMQSAGGAQQAGPPPAPTHAHTVAAVLHLREIQKHMSTILADPDAGKKNIRPKVIDAAADLLGSRALSMPEVLAALKSFPDDPKMQRAWVEKHLTDALDAQLHVLDHHAAAMPGSGDFATEWNAPREQGEQGEHMKSLMAMYGGKNG